MKNKVRSTLIQLMFYLMLALTQAVQAEDLLLFGIYATDNPASLLKKYQPLVLYLENSLTSKLGHPVTVRLVITPNYVEGVENLLNGKFQFSRLGPASYIEASEKQPNIKLLAMEIQNGAKEFYGVICLPENSSIKSIEELANKKFAFGDEKSTIGRYLSQQLLLEHGIHAKDLAAFEYLGRHDRVGIAVANGAFDAGALKENTFNKLLKTGYKLKALTKFKNITKPWVASGSLSIKYIEALQQSLLELNDKEILKVLKIDSFTTAEEDDFKYLRQSMKQNHLFFE